MRILLANPRGFCAGVDRAIEIVELALERFGPPVYVRHEIVHNRHVVETLKRAGAVFVDEPEQAPPGAVMIFSAHGVSPDVRSRAERRGLRVIDATCPLVTKVHVEARRFAAQGYQIALIGHAGHVEVEGTLGQAPEHTALLETVEGVEALAVDDPGRLAVLTQTTLSVDDTREMVERLRRRFPEIRLPRKDDICYATQNRQDAVKAMLDEVDVLLVVGAPESSNSNRLVELALRAGTAAHLVQDAADVQDAWLQGVSVVGVTAGASAPEVLVEQVVEKLRAAGGENCVLQEQPGAAEGVAFQLPAELRSGE